MFPQVAGQILLLIYSQTNTRTTGGLETVFDQDTFMGLQLDPIIVLGISIALTLKSCFTLHLKTIKAEKYSVSIFSSLFILLWAFSSSLRRVLSIVCFFIPSLGLFSILYHFKAEQIPFNIWNRYNRTQSDRIVLYGLKETVLWGELDRWDYSTDPDGIPPPYSIYTGISLEWSFISFFILSVVQFCAILIVKINTCKSFPKIEKFLDKFLHLLLNLNISSPYEDWDQGRFSVKEYKERHRETNNEMSWCLSINIFISWIMLVPLWFTGKRVSRLVKSVDFNSTLLGYQIRSRHLFLQMLTGALPEEDESYYNINICILVSTSLMVFTCIMETLTFFWYNNKVSQ